MSARASLPTVLGRLEVVAVDPATARASFEHALAGLLEGGSVAREIDLDGRRAWLKASRLSGKAAWRYGLRHGIARSAPPRMREFANLAWLRARLFRAPEPLAAGFVARGARLRFQFLLEDFLEAVVPLDEALDRAPAPERAELLDELAREIARMHALRFVHRDLYLRNVLVRPPHLGEGDPRRLAFVDAWRGGPHEWMRDEAYDLGCLMLEGAGLFTPDEQSRLWDVYFDDRAAQGRPADRGALLAGAARERAAQLVRVRRQPHRWRRSEPPRESWTPPGV
ncbi:MAG TPA: lipopolysaccharide kinase InaA family protein [Planctomycetota bacterium]|nr:lipopolysaccharide kinase InaA family protein [Planctomycetota bacterium]